MIRWIALLYAFASYASFLFMFACTILFVGDALVAKTINRPVCAPARTAARTNLLLLGGFALQHSIMARRSFKNAWMSFVPACVERNTYVLVTNATLLVVYIYWEPIADVIWHFEHPYVQLGIHSLHIASWVLVLTSTALINHADLFGLHQARARWCGRAYFSPGLVTPGPYKIVRHPLYLGWILAFWTTSRMTAGQLLFATVMTVYVVVAIQLEERDLMHEHGHKYRRYRERVPMLVPRRRPAQGERRVPRSKD